MENSESQTYQEMMTSVEKIISDISRDDVDLDHMVASVERGYGLIKSLRDRLDATKQKVEKLQLDFETAGDVD